MPTSHYDQLNQIMELVSLTKPKKLLDIGVGFGKYGFLSREYLELWHGSGKYDHWVTQIDGIEAFEKYLTPVHEYIYDRIYVGNALDVLPTLGDRYDLVLIIDVLEHFNHADGLKLLTACRERAENILISVPKNWRRQEAAFGNEYEIHRFHWRERHFEQFEDVHFLYNPSSILCYVGAQGREVLKQCKRNRHRRMLIRLIDGMQLRGLALRILPSGRHTADGA
jgi:hypothetical protein